jgi:cell division protein FtsL
VCFAKVVVCALTAILLTGSGVFWTSYNMLLALVAQDAP